MSHGPFTTGSTPSGPMDEAALGTWSTPSASLGSTSKRRHVSSRRNDPDYVPRPRNQWNIFVVEYAKKVEGTKSNCILKSASNVWRSMSKEQREPYRQRAQLEAEIHKKRYPDYRYGSERHQKSRKGEGNKPDITTLGLNSFSPPFPGNSESVGIGNVPAHSQDQMSPEVPLSAPNQAVDPVLLQYNLNADENWGNLFHHGDPRTCADVDGYLEYGPWDEFDFCWDEHEVVHWQ